MKKDTDQTVFLLLFCLNQMIETIRLTYNKKVL